MIDVEFTADTIGLVLATFRPNTFSAEVYSDNNSNKLHIALSFSLQLDQLIEEKIEMGKLASGYHDIKKYARMLCLIDSVKYEWKLNITNLEEQDISNKDIMSVLCREQYPHQYRTNSEQSCIKTLIKDSITYTFPDNDIPQSTSSWLYILAVGVLIENRFPTYEEILNKAIKQTKISEEILQLLIKKR